MSLRVNLRHSMCTPSLLSVQAFTAHSLNFHHSVYNPSLFSIQTRSVIQHVNHCGSTSRLHCSVCRPSLLHMYLHHSGFTMASLDLQCLTFPISSDFYYNHAGIKKSQYSSALKFMYMYETDKGSTAKLCMRNSCGSLHAFNSGLQHSPSQLKPYTYNLFSSDVNAYSSFMGSSMTISLLLASLLWSLLFSLKLIIVPRIGCHFLFALWDCIFLNLFL